MDRPTRLKITIELGDKFSDIQQEYSRETYCYEDRLSLEIMPLLTKLMKQANIIEDGYKLDVLDAGQCKLLDY
tara:strand:- start:483 stop:701 length:219 start_codon:yes stop_codon:yes gene_type:complete